MGEGGTMFESFYLRCRRILCSDTATHERRAAGSDDILYGSQVTSISHLRTKTIEALKKDIEMGTIKQMPSVPSLESIQLKLVANSGVVNASSNLAGGLRVK